MMRSAIKTAIWLALMAATLFIAGDDWHWPQAWLFLAEIGLSTAAITTWLTRHDPTLLRERLSAPLHHDQVGWDRIFLPSALVVFFGWMVLIALDARRFAWSHVPLWLQALGALAIAACMILTWQTFRHNTFAVPQARVQVDRGQHVISDGPYSVVRHPMYAGALLYFIGMPLMLGSWLGLMVVPLLAAGLGARAVGEERMLRRELAGYAAYAARVTSRMIPGVW